MEELATYYVTLEPIREGGVNPIGAKNIAYVNDPALQEVGVYLSEQNDKIVASENQQNLILEYLKTVGQVKQDNWRLATEDEYIQAQQLNLSIEDSESDNDLNKKGGGGRWLVRYRYSGPQDDKTRSFCSEVLSMDKLYTEEEITNGLSNPEFGNYSIFDYKGSYGCRHVWKREIYFEDYEDDAVRRVGFVPQVVARLDDAKARTLNVFLSKDEKMQVVAPLLIPEKKIFRNDAIGRYNMVFSKNTIREIFKRASSNGTLEKEGLFKDTHDGGVAPSYVLDAWISEDENDKAYTEFGLSITSQPIGTLFVHSQITDKDYWENEIKKNKKYAYSIEAATNLTIIKMSKMKKEQIKLPDGEHLINGTIYVVKGGEVMETKEVTSEQEDVIEEVAQELPKEELSEEPKEEEKPVEQMEEMPVAPVEETAPAEGIDRIAKLEQQQDELMSEIAKLRSEMVKPDEESVEVAMSDARPAWVKVSQGIEVLKQQKSKQ